MNMTIYLSHLAKARSEFDSISSEWWSEEGSFKALHSMNLVRVPWIWSRMNNGAPKDCSKPLNGFKILDVGCGGGILTVPLARLGAHVVGIDESANSLIEADRKISQLRNNQQEKLSLELINQPLEVFSVERMDDHNSFDAVVLSEVLEHVDDVEFSVKSATQMLKPEGHIFVTTINRTWKSLVFAKYIAEYVLRLLPTGLHSWDKFITPEELKKIFADDGLEQIELAGLKYHPFANAWSWSKNCDMNYAICARKCSDPSRSYNQDNNCHG